MISLWKPAGWPERLAELEARTGELKEAPLRRDVRSLGMLLGEVLREQAGDALFAAGRRAAPHRHRTPRGRRRAATTPLRRKQPAADAAAA